MKILSVFIAVLLLISNVVSQTPITLTFQAKDLITLNALALDSVNVKNLTKDCDTTLYDSVSVLNIVALSSYGLEDPTSRYSEAIVLMPNVPNPFQGSTMVSIYLKNAGELNLGVYNNQGKQLSEYRNLFEKGWHLFDISTLVSGHLILRVSNDKTTQTVKLISSSIGTEGERVSYMGQSGQDYGIHKSTQDASGFVFYLGNQMEYKSYANGYLTSTITDNPITSKSYTFTIIPVPFTCGNSMTIKHVAGAVAPVNKTTTYGTITNIPGETSKCWITSNLGSDHQATAVNDFTEASAGWYWQFNRKQGFKRYYTTLPAWTITSINENSDWLIANDPCNIELGTTWRIPTGTEYYNVDNTGGWTNRTGPWNSGLKLHAAGSLNKSDGSLLGCGSYGAYCSSTQSDATNLWFLGFDGSASNMSSNSKAYGYCVRCIRDY